LPAKDPQPAPNPAAASTDETSGIAPRGAGRFTLLGGLAVILVLCVVLTLLAQSTGRLPTSNQTEPVGLPPAAALLASDTINNPGALFVVLPGSGDAPDIYYVAPTPNATPVNLTDSAGLEELNPRISPDGKTIAFLARTTDGRVDLYVRSVPDGQARPITLQTGNTQLHNGFDIDLGWPPQWSPAGTWLSFLAKQSDGKGDAVDLYIVRSQSGELQAITDGNQVIDFTWLSDQEISYVQERANGKGTVYRRAISSPGAMPTAVATLQIQR
jgi:hypothetical protein